ncbi:AbfB domain-containing protein [Streptomyces caeni]|uniref:AbfB domain-containing protein n=1 Tax=Streptomyces caeni TaxID=2307231 RepID=A0ABW4ISY8_9ACTN
MSGSAGHRAAQGNRSPKRVLEARHVHYCFTGRAPGGHRRRATRPWPAAPALESVNYPGRFLRHQNFQLRLDPYQQTSPYRADSAFRLVNGLA